MTGALLFAKCLSMCLRFESSGSPVVCVVRVVVDRLIGPLLGEGTSPFIDEGDGLTSERERESTHATKSCCPCRRVQDDGRRPQSKWA